jgi:hypothetical protein
MLKIIRPKETSQTAVVTGSKRNKWGYPYIQIKFYMAIAAPMFVYGNENWALNISGRRNTETVGMCLMRHISRYTLTGHLCNALKIISFRRIQDCKNKCHNCTKRMDSSRLTQKAKNYQPEEQKNIV